MKRNCYEVIQKMLNEIPKDKIDFIKDLSWNLNDAYYKAPEEVIQWERTQETLIKHIPKPTEDWEYEILSIWSTKPVGEIKNYYKNENKLTSTIVEKNQNDLKLPPYRRKGNIDKADPISYI